VPMVMTFVGQPLTVAVMVTLLLALSVGLTLLIQPNSRHACKPSMPAMSHHESRTDGIWTGYEPNFFKKVCLRILLVQNDAPLSSIIFIPNMIFEHTVTESSLHPLGGRACRGIGP